MKNIGTSSIIVAAFVGPGTVLTCASAGVRFSYDLAWVLIFATAGVFVLQTFTAGTGILGRKGLGEAIRQVTSNRRIRIPVFVLVVLGLWIGSAAFETGNLVGASAGLHVVFGDLFDPRWWSLPIVLIAGAILLLDMRAIRNALTALIMLMSLLFIGTMLVSPVDWGSAIRGLVVPSIPEDSIVTIIALTGTTIVTYNLFLHASATKAFWADQPAASSWRRELFGMGIFLPLGGLISLAILFAGATIFTGSAEVSDVGSFAAMLEPVAGSASRYLFGFGLFAAGITSAVTAPLAVAAGIGELFSWPADRKDIRFRGLWISVLLTGLMFSLTGFSPLNVIIAAQAANGLLLPFIAGVLVYVTLNQKEITLPRRYVFLGVVITTVCGFLGIRTLVWVWNNLL